MWLCDVASCHSATLGRGQHWDSAARHRVRPSAAGQLANTHPRLSLKSEPKQGFQYLPMVGSAAFRKWLELSVDTLNRGNCTDAASQASAARLSTSQGLPAGLRQDQWPLHLVGQVRVCPSYAEHTRICTEWVAQRPSTGVKSDEWGKERYGGTAHEVICVGRSRMPPSCAQGRAEGDCRKVEDGHHDPSSPASRELTGHPVSDMIFQKRRQRISARPSCCGKTLDRPSRARAGMTEVYACTHKAKPVPCRRNCHISGGRYSFDAAVFGGCTACSGGRTCVDGRHPGARAPRLGIGRDYVDCTSQRRIWSAISVAVAQATSGIAARSRRMRNRRVNGTRISSIR